MIRSLVFVLVLVVAGCSPGSKPASPAASVPTAEPGVAAVVPAAGADMVEFSTLTDQREVWDCPKCGMMFDRAGMCTMCDVDLVRTRIDYSCAADGQPVEHGGKCPRCAVPVVIKKTALVSSLESPALGGK
ncbi:MAG: hypothetical protein ABIU54_14700 [Candidatus Eisenbacteria bacterium]